MRKQMILVLMCSLMIPPLWAAAKMKPGLWEMTMRSDAMKDMPAIPPEQQEQMRQMGISVPQIRNGEMVTRVCITRQMAERDHLPGMDQNELGCKTSNVRRNGQGYSVDIVCNGPAMKGEGQARGTLSGEESFTSTYEFKGTLQGLPVSQQSQTSGRWLSADCGNVKPMTDLMPKN